jgi:uncharacterized protein (DUF1684 family)
LEKNRFLFPRIHDMTELTREQVLTTLGNEWGTYISRFQAFTPEQQKEFLKRQGFARLADLLAHVIAWWTDGQERIKAYLTDPDLPGQEYDVDDFNAKAVAKYSATPEKEVIRLFEEKRAAWVTLVAALPADAFQNEKLRARLHIEVIGHLEEHAL